MIMRQLLIGAVLVFSFLLISLTLVGKPLPRAARPSPTPANAPPADTSLAFAAAVTVARAAPADFVETVLVTGSLVAREEILVGPEVEGLRITQVLATYHEKRRGRPEGWAQQMRQALADLSEPLQQFSDGQIQPVIAAYRAARRRRSSKSTHL